MNSILSKQVPRALIDTTVLCGALRQDGLNRALLRLARASEFFTPVLSCGCLFKFYKHAIEGLGHIRYSFEEIENFLDEFVYPLTDRSDVANSRVRRESIEIILAEHRPLGDVLIELSACTPEQALSIITQHEMQEPLRQFDRNDFHVWVTAIQQNCDVILTSNTRHFPTQIGSIQRVHPRDFYNNLSLE